MLQDQIKKSNEEDVSTHIEIAKAYEKMVHILVLLSKITIILSGLLSFIATKFDYWYISFSSGSLNFLATSMISYSSYLSHEKIKINKSINKKLTVMGIADQILISENDSDKSI